MAIFNEELPNNLIKQFKSLEDNVEKMIGEMTQEGANVAYKNIVSNMKKSFKTTKSLEKGLKITRVYKTPKDGGINTHVGFYGYDGIKTKKYPKGKPIPLKAMAREYGTPTEEKKPFLRKSFKKKEIEMAMTKVQEKYIGDN